MGIVPLIFGMYYVTKMTNTWKIIIDINWYDEWTKLNQ